MEKSIRDGKHSRGKADDDQMITITYLKNDTEATGNGNFFFFFFGAGEWH